MKSTHRFLSYSAIVVFLALLRSDVPKADRWSRHLQEKGSQKEFSELRFLAFGTSRAWGAGLKNRYDAYPFLLSPNTTNLAIRAAGCEYPSLCTISMVGDKIYDVILIEYNHVSEDKLYYQSLARKLRHRFPEATMVFLYAWSPFQYTDGEGKNAFDVRQSLYPSPRGMKRRLGEMWHSISNNVTDWRFDLSLRNKEIVYETARQVDGHVWELPILEDHSDNLKTYGPSFLPDCTHYSIAGHKLIQEGINNLLRDANPIRDNTVEAWDSWDKCESWFATGNTTLSTDMKMIEFSPDKFALEAPGWIELKVERGATLSINYMAGGPEQIYPKTMIRLGEKHVLEAIPVVKTHASGKQNVHVVQTLKVGKVEAGTIKLQMFPMEEKENPFRIVGIVMTTEEEPVAQVIAGK